ncbi:hypothetical protein BSIN_3655 [Burkholderia singularis]|uniref:Uncharacterized protein n=1 Tax=Burkholderia singularis TaxID=1503053 RepID=A0A238H5R5_9BURK|nr:hypothetical protein BSIN_3655 [Burkholderia singularis]
MTFRSCQPTSGGVYRCISLRCAHRAPHAVPGLSRDAYPERR